MTSHECRNPDCRICFEYVGRARRGACPRCGNEAVDERRDDGSCADFDACTKRRRQRDEPKEFGQLRALGEWLRRSSNTVVTAVLADGSFAKLYIASDAVEPNPVEAPPSYCPHGIGDDACSDRVSCARRWRAEQRAEKTSSAPQVACSTPAGSSGSREIRGESSGALEDAARHRDAAVQEIVQSVEDLPGVHNAAAADFRARLAWIVEGFYGRRRSAEPAVRTCSRCGSTDDLVVCGACHRLLADEEKKEALDAVYAERDKLVALVAAMARALGMTAGLGQHNPNDASWDAEWRNIVFVELPTGQVSWHVHERELPWFAGLARYLPAWDGHTTEEKYDRVLEAARGLASMAGNDRWKENYSYLYKIIEMRNARIEELEAAASVYRELQPDPVAAFRAWTHENRGSLKTAEELDAERAADRAEEVEQTTNDDINDHMVERAMRSTSATAPADLRPTDIGDRRAEDWSCTHCGQLVLAHFTHGCPRPSDAPLDPRRVAALRDFTGLEMGNWLDRAEAEKIVAFVDASRPDYPTGELPADLGLREAAQLIYQLTEVYQHRPDGLRALVEARSAILRRAGRDPNEQGKAHNLPPVQRPSPMQKRSDVK